MGCRQIGCNLIAVGLLASCAHHYERWTPDLASVTDEELSIIHAWPNEGLSTDSPEAYFQALRLKANPEHDKSRIESIGRENGVRQALMYGEEREIIERRRRNPDIGLALSGGGIRSAAFSLGVMKGLHEVGVLDRIGYLSTVSGGGFTGGWYVSHRADQWGAPSSDHELFAPGSRHIQRIVQSGHYLTSANFSKTRTESGKAVLRHILGLPSIWTLNWLFDVQPNWTSHICARYRYSIASTFLYDKVEDRLAADWINYVQKNIENPLYLRLVEIPHLLADLPRFPYALVSGLEATLWRARNWQLFLTRMPGALKGFDGLGVYASPRLRIPYWIVNAHVSLTEDDGIDTRNRSGDAFEITPLRSGCDTLGYVKTVGSCEHDTTWQRVEQAMAISGAAVDSDSLKQGPLASLALKAVGLDLGYWVNAWGKGWVKGDGFWPVTRSRIRYAFEAIAPIRWIVKLSGGETTHGRNKNAGSYSLTDGGHFDNTGMYALVRRGCRLLIVVDATGEPNLQQWNVNAIDQAKLFDSFRSTESRLRTDFGVTLEMNWDQFNPTDAEQLVMDGRILNLPILPRNSDPESAHASELSLGARILYVRAGYDLASARKSASFVDQQKARNHAFPNIPTSDQSYEEVLMNSMMELGYRAIVDNKSRFMLALEELH